jgi:hypothetical protein
MEGRRYTTNGSLVDLIWLLYVLKASNGYLQYNPLQWRNYFETIPNKSNEGALKRPTR